jgi:hypothetical protein
VVHHAAQAQRLALTAVVLLAAGCGGGSDAAPKATTAHAAAVKVIHKDLGVDVRLADCTNWARGDRDARLGTIHEIATAVPDQAELTDDQAYTLFENWCSHSYATAFKLYKLYTRAAAFTPQTP